MNYIHIQEDKIFNNLVIGIFKLGTISVDIFLSIIISLFVGSISYIYIEKPLRKYFNYRFVKC